MKPFFFSAGVPVLLTLVMAGCGSSKDDSKAEKSKAEKRADESITQIAQLTPPQVLDGGYVSSTVCKSCHSNQHESWHKSYHRTMTQAASPQVVAASFENVELSFRGQKATLERRGDEFWVDMVDPLWEMQQVARHVDVSYAVGAPRVQRRIVMTTGSHHFQVYWFNRDAFSRELWQFPWRYHLVEQRWVHRQNVFLQPPNGPLGIGFRVWNTDCISCHTVGGKPGFDVSTGLSVDTSVVELGISCEACHGPGQRHVEIFSAKDAASKQIRDTAIVHPAKISPARSAQICGACHSSHVVSDPESAVTDGLKFRPGEDFTRVARFRVPPDEPDSFATRFWADGVSRSGGREYLGMVKSSCFEHGAMSCISCHSMHSYEKREDQLSPRMETNEACYQCHESWREDLTAHTHHAADSSGSLCYNCHMPHTSYALYKGIRDHSISIPSVTSIRSNIRPNACNLCHLDKTLEWTARNLANWRGESDEQIRKDLNLLTDDERSVAASLLYLLRGDAGQRVIAAYSMGWDDAQAVSKVDWLAPPLAKAMLDPYAAVRYNAFRATRKLPGFADFKFDFEVPGDAVELNRRVRERWKLPAPNAREPASRVLLDDQMQPNDELIDRLIEVRDNRPIFSIE